MTDTSPAALLAVAEQFAKTSTVPANFSAVLRAIAAEKEAQAKRELIGDSIEAAYWSFDARRKGYGPWKTTPMSERDAFKAEICNALFASQHHPELLLNMVAPADAQQHTKEWCKNMAKVEADAGNPEMTVIAPADVQLPEPDRVDDRESESVWRIRRSLRQGGCGFGAERLFKAQQLDARYPRRPTLKAMEMREALELIATPKRPDGTWNRDREACRQLAAEALGRYDEEQKGM